MACDNQRTEELSRLLRAIIHALLEQRINLCILRNYEELPEYTRHDVDLLVSPADRHRTLNLIMSVAKYQSWQLLSRTEDLGQTGLCFCFDRSRDIQFISFDVATELCWGWMPIVDSMHVLNSKYIRDGIPVASHGADAAARVMKNVLRGSPMSDCTRRVVAEYARRDQAGFYATLAGILDGELVGRILRIIECGAWEELDQLTPLLRKSLIFHVHSSRPWQGLCNFLRYVWGRCKPNGQSALGTHVVLLGPDGIGKSTLAGRLKSRLGEQVFRGAITYHGNFHILPTLQRLRRFITGRETKVPDFTKRHSGSAVKSHSPLRSLLYLGYYSIDFLLGYVVLWNGRSRHRLILFDRYFYDYYFQPANRRVPGWVLNCFRCFVPRPDVLLSLLASPGVVYRRKPELTKHDIQHQLELMERLVAHLSKEMTVVQVRTDQGEDAAEDDAIRAIVHAVSNRQLDRIHNEVRRAA